MISAIIRNRADCTGWAKGQLGPGLYFSSSAVDCMDRGPFVAHALLKEDTRVLMVEPRLFGVGTQELFPMILKRLKWDFAVPAGGKSAIPRIKDPETAVPRLMQELGLEAAVYVYGFHLGVLVRSAGCLRENTEWTSVHSVADYVRENPWDSPMLAPPGALERWLENNRSPF